MKKDFLTGLGIDEETASKIMAENGKDIEREKGKFADYDDVKNQLKAANDKITSFGDVDAVKNEVEKYKAEALKAQTDAEAKIRQIERQAQIKDFTGGKKFVNDITRDAINEQLLKELDKEESKGKSLDDLFKVLTDGKQNVLSDDNAPKPPVVTPMAGNPPAGLSGVESAFQKLNPTLKL